MCFAMREGIVHQQLDVCGDVETNVNERRTTTAAAPANPLSFFHVPSSPGNQPPSPYHPFYRSLYTDFIYFSLPFSLTNVCILLSFRIRCDPLFIHIHRSFIVLYVPTDVYMRSMCCIYYWYSQYVKHQSKRIRRQPHKYLCIQYWAWHP